MKIKTLITAAFIIMLGVLNLDANAADKLKSDPMTKLFEQNMRIPDHLKNEVHDGFVLVEFTVDDSGIVSVLQSNASNPAMNTFVIHRLNGMKLDGGIAERNKTYYRKFIFKTI